MSWLRRLSRDRSSRGEQDSTMPNFRNSTSYDDNQNTPPFRKDTQYSPQASQDVLSYRRSMPLQDSQGNNTPQRPPGSSDATMMHGGVGSSTRIEPTPDPLARAFNDAIKPYLDQIEQLDRQMAEMHLRIQQLEDERTEIHSWIDKRGFRPGMYMNPPKLPHSPPSYAHIVSYHITMMMKSQTGLTRINPQTCPPTSPNQWTSNPTRPKPSTSNSTAK